MTSIKDLELTKILYLPIVDIHYTNRPYTTIRSYLRPILPLVEEIVNKKLFCKMKRKGYRFVYLSVHKDYIKKGSHLMREGWHVDGYKTDDITYIYVDGQPTEFLDNKHIPKTVKKSIKNGELGHKDALDLFEHLGSYLKTRALPVNKWVNITGIIHRTPLIAESHVRTFIKINISKHKYNLQGNAISDINEEWKLYDREDIRNHPVFIKGDSCDTQ